MTACVDLGPGTQRQQPSNANVQDIRHFTGVAVSSVVVSNGVCLSVRPSSVSRRPTAGRMRDRMARMNILFYALPGTDCSRITRRVASNVARPTRERIFLQLLNGGRYGAGEIEASAWPSFGLARYTARRPYIWSLRSQCIEVGH